MPILTVVVKDIETGRGVPNAKVCLFVGGGGLEQPANSNLSGVTNQSGIVKFDVPSLSFFRVGVIAYGYTASQPDHAPPEGWEKIWSCWGACGVARDFEYQFEVIKSDLSPEAPPISALGIVLGLALAGTVLLKALNLI
jgi:hypothetical protein